MLPRKEKKEEGRKGERRASGQMMPLEGHTDNIVRYSVAACSTVLQ